MADLGSMVIHLRVDDGQVLTTEIALQNLGIAADKAANKSASSFKRMISHANMVAQRIRTVGYLTSTVLTAPIMGAGTAILNTTKDFEFSMQKIVGLVGLAQGVVDNWSQSILKMAPAVGKSPKELAESLYFISSSGIKGAEALDVLEVSARAATAGLGETQAVADLLTSVLNAYAGTGMTAAKAADILVAAVREGKGEADAYARTLGQLVPIAANLGVSFDQVAGGLAAMTLTGSSAANAAVYLKGVFNALMTANDQGAKVLSRVGTSYAELRNILKSGPNGLINLMQKLRDIQMQYGDEALKDILPNIRALTGFLSIAGKNFQYNTKIMQEISKSTGSLNAAFMAVEDTIKVKLDKAIAGLQVSLITLGTDVVPTIIKVIEGLTMRLDKMVQHWNTLTEAQKKFRLEAIAIAAAIGPVTLFASAVIYLATGVAQMVKGLYVGIKAITLFTVASFKGKAGLEAFFTTMKVKSATSVAALTASFGPWIALITGLTLAYRHLKKARDEAEAALPSSMDASSIDPYLEELKTIRGGDFGDSEIESKMKLLSKMDMEQLREFQNVIATRIQLEKNFRIKLMAVREKGLDDDEYITKRRNQIFELGQTVFEKQKSLGYVKKGGETYIAIEKEIDAVKNKMSSFSKEIVDHKKQMDSWIDDQITKIPEMASKYEGFQKQVDDMLGSIEGLLKLTDEQAQSILEYNEDLQKVIDTYDSTLAYLEYMRVNAKKLGIEFDYLGEKSKLMQDTLEDLGKISALKTDFAEKINKDLSELPTNLFSVIQSLKELGKEFKYIDERAKIDIEFDVHSEKLKAVESVRDELLRIKSTLKEGEHLTIPFANGIGVLIPISDMLSGKIDDLTNNMNDLKIAQQDAIDTRTLALLDAEASAFKTIGARIDVFTYQLEAARRRLRQLLQQQMDPKAEIIPKGVIDKAVDNIQRLEIALQLLKHQADITHLENLYREIGTADIGMNLLSAHINEVEDALRYLSDQNRGSSKEFEILADRLFALKNAETVVDTLSGAFDEFFDAVIDGSENLGEVMGQIFKNIMLDTIKMLAKLLIVKTIMATLFPAQSAAKTAISVGQMLGIGLKEGGVVPQGYPNDTFPARLSSGEIVIPKDKYKDIDPLRQLADKGRINAREFFDMPAEYMKTLQIPKLQTGGVIPPGYPNDTYPAFLSSGETVLPAWYTGLLANYKQQPAWEGDVVKAVDTIGQRLHNFFSDLATGILSWGTQLRKPSVEELTKGRGDWGGRAELLGKGATWGMADMLTGEVTSKVVPAVAKKLSSIPKLISPVREMESAYNITVAPEIQKIREELICKLEAIEIGNEWSKNWWTHPATQGRIANQRQSVYEPLSKLLPSEVRAMPDDQYFKMFASIDQWGQILERIDDGLYKSRMALPSEVDILDQHVASGMWSSKLKGPIQGIVHPDLSIPELVSSSIHEGTHGVTHADKFIPEIVKEELQSILYTLDDYNKFVKNIPPTKVNSAREYFDYMRRPTEIYSRLMELRKAENLNPGQLITESRAGNMIELGSEYFKYSIDPTFFKMIKSPKALADIMNKLPMLGGAGLGIGASLFGGQEAKAGEVPQNYLDKLLTYNDILKQTTPLLQAKTAATQADALAMDLSTNAASTNAEAMRSIQSVVKGMLDTEKIGNVAATATAGISNLELGTGINPNELIPTNNTAIDLSKQGSALSAAVALAVQSGIALLVTNISDSLTKDIRPAEGVDSSKGFAPIFNALMGLTGMLVGGPIGGAIGGLLGNLFSGNKMMKGGIVPPGYPNDTYPAWLTSGETILPNSYRERMAKMMQGSKYLNRMAKMSRSGSLPKTYMRDTHLARLSGKDKLVSPQRLEHLAPAEVNVNLTLDSKIKNRDIALLIRRMKNWN